MLRHQFGHLYNPCKPHFNTAVLSLVMLQSTVQEGQFYISQLMHVFNIFSHHCNVEDKEMWPSFICRMKDWWKKRLLIRCIWEVTLSAAWQMFICPFFFFPFDKGLHCQWGVDNFYTRYFQETSCHLAWAFLCLSHDKMPPIHIFKVLLLFWHRFYKNTLCSYSYVFCFHHFDCFPSLVFFVLLKLFSQNVFWHAG